MNSNSNPRIVTDYDTLEDIRKLLCEGKIEEARSDMYWLMNPGDPRKFGKGAYPDKGEGKGIFSEYLEVHDGTQYYLNPSAVKGCQSVMLMIYGRGGG